MMIFGIIAQTTMGHSMALSCDNKCRQMRGRTICWNPCFTPGTSEYEYIQNQLNDPCSEEGHYWRRFYIDIGRAVPPFEQCNQRRSRVQRSPIKSDCISAGELRQMDSISRCQVVKFDGACENIFDLMTPDEIMQLGRDSNLC